MTISAAAIWKRRAGGTTGADMGGGVRKPGGVLGRDGGDTGDCTRRGKKRGSKRRRRGCGGHRATPVDPGGGVGGVVGGDIAGGVRYPGGVEAPSDEGGGCTTTSCGILYTGGGGNGGGVMERVKMG